MPTTSLPPNPRRVVVAFHAHPDDEVVLTGGTLAMLAEQGHRVIIVVATDGVVDHPEDPAGLDQRLAELRTAAKILGVADVHHLGYADSGHGPAFFPDPPGRVRFARAPVDEAAQKLAEILRREDADLLLSYDAQGNYGHRDHVQVHAVGTLAATIAGTPRTLEATMPRELVQRVSRLLDIAHLPAPYDTATLATAYTPKRDITHTISVRRQMPRKMQALAAHVSQTRTGRISSLARMALRLPGWVYAPVLGREWFVDPALPDTRSSTIF